MRKVIAAAACVLLMIGSGVGYYQGNLAVYSTIVVSAAADVSMQVNSHGKVLSLESINLYGEQLLKNYDGKGKDKLLVTNELIQKAIAMGYLVSGDTVYFYIDTPKSAVYSSYKSELEQEMTAYTDLNTAVEQYRINEPLPEKAQPETETTQETEIPVVASETISETTVPESSTPEQEEVTVQEEISPQPEITPQEEPVQPIQEEIPILNDVPQENPPQIQETEPDIPVNAIPLQMKKSLPLIENENSEIPETSHFQKNENSPQNGTMKTGVIGTAMMMNTKCQNIPVVAGMTMIKIIQSNIKKTGISGEIGIAMMNVKHQNALKMIGIGICGETGITGMIIAIPLIQQKMRMITIGKSGKVALPIMIIIPMVRKNGLQTLQNQKKIFSTITDEFFGIWVGLLNPKNHHKLKKALYTYSVQRL